MGPATLQAHARLIARDPELAVSVVLESESERIESREDRSDETNVVDASLGIVQKRGRDMANIEKSSSGEKPASKKME